MTASLHFSAVLALLIAAGLMPSMAVLGRTPQAVAAAPLVTALSCSIAATLSVLLKLRLELVLVVVFVSISVVAARSLLTRRASATSAEPGSAWLESIGLAALLAIPLLAIRRPPIDWDTRAIWFLHADWLLAGGAKAVSAMGNGAYVFSQPDYPPLAPGTVASVWTLLGRDFEIAQVTVALLVASALLTLGFALRTVITGRPRWQTWVAAAVVMIGAYGLAGAYGTNGYVDLLWAAAFAAGALILLVASPTARTDALGVLCLAVATSTKNEGVLAGIVVLVIVLVRRRAWNLRLAAAPVAVVAFWRLAAGLAGAQSDVVTNGRFADLVHLRSDVLARARPIVGALWRDCGWELCIAALLTAIGVVVTRRQRDGVQPKTVAGAGGLWMATTAALAAVGFAYMVSGDEVGWYLRNSVDRTTIAPRLVLLVLCALWLLELADAMGGHQRSRQPELGARRSVRTWPVAGQHPPREALEARGLPYATDADSSA